MTPAEPAEPAPRPILAISSTVAAGHVGLSAVVPVVQLAGREITALPTVMLSNHPGFANVAGTRIAPETLDAMLEAIAANGWLDRFGTVLTGYLPSAEHAVFAARAIDQVRRANPDVRVICDPILGDAPGGLYIDAAAAAAIRADLLPRADLALPNAFELGWLTGEPVACIETAAAAALRLQVGDVIVTSVPAGPDAIANVQVTDGFATTMTVARREAVPKGTGDALSGLIAAGWPLARAIAALDVMIESSGDGPHLAIVPAAAAWREVRDSPGTGGRVSVGHSGDTGWVAGVDGCPGGWLTVAYPLGRAGEATCEIVPRFEDLLTRTPALAAIAVDMPVGLPDIAEVGGRTADRLARARLGDRQSSVFAIPSRAAIACTDYRAACGIAFATSDPPRKVAKQTFYLFPKIRELDAVVTPALQDRIVECHPEVAFWAMNGHQPLSEPKKMKSRPYGPGLDLRRRLLVSQGFAPEFLEKTAYPSRLAGIDDLLDACAAAWTAARVATGEAERLPADPPRDARGLRMEIVF